LELRLTLRKIGRTFLASIAMGIIAYGVYYLTIPYLRNSASVILAIIAGIISYTMFVIMFNVITEEELKELPKGEKLLPIFLKAKKIRNKIFGIKTNR
jgi:hypothetical protein